VWLAENAPAALAAIQANLSALKITRGFTLEDRGTGALLQRLTKPLNIVFLDPPYEAESEYVGTLSFFGSARGRGLLAPDALVLAEHSSKLPLPERFGGLEQVRRLRQGDAAVGFYKVSVP
jgi:16S rRNA G966 N2-methylase RsmD